MKDVFLTERDAIALLDGAREIIVPGEEGEMRLRVTAEACAVFLRSTTKPRSCGGCGAASGQDHTPNCNGSFD